MSNLKKNLGYQTLYQVLNVGLPLITAPFLSRVFGSRAIRDYVLYVINRAIFYFICDDGVGELWNKKYRCCKGQCRREVVTYSLRYSICSLLPRVFHVAAYFEFI
jgi:hypothetical protein